MALFQIPKRYYQAVRDLIALNEQQSSKLIEALQELPLSLNSKQAIAALSSKFEEIKLLHAEEIISFLASLHYLLEKVDEKISIQQLVLDIAEAVNNEESLPNLNQEDKRKFSEGLAAFLKASSVLAITAKAAKLLLDHERVYLESRILTDIRTVFKESNEQPIGAVVVHNLKITYRQDDNEKEFFVALDGSDLFNLSQEIARAETKAKEIKMILEKAEVTYLSGD
jgi:hypothetical protein